jgi:hypothetical protein
MAFVQSARVKKSIAHLENCCSEAGSVESALVVIPLMVLFLISMQLVLTISARNNEIAIVQSEATRSAISHVLTPDAQVINLGEAPSLTDLALVITHRRREIINLLPAGLSGPRKINQSRASDVTGIAVVEPESK